MATYPTGKVHRPSRRHLSKGQTVQTTPVTTLIQPSSGDGADAAVILFSRPCGFTLPITLTGTALPIASQTVRDPQTVLIIFTAAVTGKTATIATNPAGVSPIGGGSVTGSTETFP